MLDAEDVRHELDLDDARDALEGRGAATSRPTPEHIFEGGSEVRV